MSGTVLSIVYERLDLDYETTHLERKKEAAHKEEAMPHSSFVSVAANLTFQPLVARFALS